MIAWEVALTLAVVLGCIGLASGIILALLVASATEPAPAALRPPPDDEHAGPS